VAQEGYGRPRGINSEGLKRRGFDAGRISSIKRAYRALYVSGASLEEARARLAEIAGESEDVRAVLDFIDSGERPLLRQGSEPRAWTAPTIRNRPGPNASRWWRARPPATCWAPG